MAHDALYSDEFSFGYADQTAYDEEASVTGNWLACTFPNINVERVIFDEPRSTGQVGASAKRGIGKMSGSFTFSAIATSQAVGWTPSGGPAKTNPVLDLLEELHGASATGAYESAVASVTATGNTLDTGAAKKLGCAYGFGASASAVRGLAWIESLVSSTNYQLTHDVRALPANDDIIFPLITMYPAAVHPTPKTFRLVGAVASQDIRFVGCFPTQAVITMGPGDQIIVEFTYSFSYIVFASSGALQALTQYQVIPTLLGRNNARAVVAANILTDYDDGTADPDGACEVTDLKVTLSLEPRPVDCHGGYEGVSAMKGGRRRCMVDFTVPKVAEFESGGLNIFIASLRDQSPLAFALEAGTAAGGLFGFRSGGLIVSKEPGRGVKEGKYGYQVSCDAGIYTGDGASTDAGNKPWVTAFG